MTVALQLRILFMLAKLKVLLYVVSILKNNKMKRFVPISRYTIWTRLSQMKTGMIKVFYHVKLYFCLILMFLVLYIVTQVASHTRRWIRYNVKRINKLI